MKLSHFHNIKKSSWILHNCQANKPAMFQCQSDNIKGCVCQAGLQGQWYGWQHGHISCHLHMQWHNDKPFHFIFSAVKSIQNLYFIFVEMDKIDSYKYTCHHDKYNLVVCTILSNAEKVLSIRHLMWSGILKYFQHDYFPIMEINFPNDESLYHIKDPW